jgi:hypothetical protein
LWVNHIKRYLVSSAVTFISFGLPAGVVFIQTSGWGAATTSAFWVGLSAVILRAGGKAVWDMFVALVPKIISYLKSLTKE